MPLVVQPQHGLGMAHAVCIGFLRAAPRTLRATAAQIQLDDLKRCAHGAAHALSFSPKHAVHFGGQLRAVLLGQFERAARMGVLIGAREHQEHGGSAGIRFFDGDLRESGVIAADLVELSGERGVVAGVAEQHGAEFSIGRRYLEYGHVGIGRALRDSRRFSLPLASALAAVDGEGRASIAEPQARPGQIVQRSTNHRDQSLGQLGCILRDHLAIGRAQLEHGLEIAAYEWTGMGM